MGTVGGANASAPSGVGSQSAAAGTTATATPGLTNGPDLLVTRAAPALTGKSGLADRWSSLAGSATDMQVAGTRIAFHDTNGHVWAKDGLSGMWHDEGGP